jgi:hypothetical protein
MTELSLPGPHRNMLAAAVNALCSTQTSTEIVFC